MVILADIKEVVHIFQALHILIIKIKAATYKSIECSEHMFEVFVTGQLAAFFAELLTRRLLFSTNKEGEQILRYFEIIGPLEGQDLK